MLPVEIASKHNTQPRSGYGGKRNRLYTRLIVRWLERLHLEFKIPYQPVMLSEQKSLAGLKYYWKCVQDLPENPNDDDPQTWNVSGSLEMLDDWIPTQDFLTRFFVDVIYKTNDTQIREVFPRQATTKSSLQVWQNHAVVISIQHLRETKRVGVDKRLEKGAHEVGKLLQNVKVVGVLNQLDQRLTLALATTLKTQSESSSGLSSEAFHNLVLGALVFLLGEVEFQRLRYAVGLYALEFQQKHHDKRISASAFEEIAVSIYIMYKLATGVRLSRESLRGRLLASEFDNEFCLIPDGQRAQFKQVYDLLRQRVGTYNLRHVRMFPETVRLLDWWLEWYLMMPSQQSWQLQDENIGAILQDFRQQLGLGSATNEGSQS